MDNELIKRYSLVEITLLAIFVLGLGLAQIIVKVRNRIRLSDLIVLDGAGLSVPMPINPGWEHESLWHFESDNSIALVAKHQQGRFRDASVQWRYHLCAPEGSAREILTEHIRQSNATAGEIETIDGAIKMDFTVVTPGSTDQPFYLGFSRLDFGRCLELRIYPHYTDKSYAENLFLTLAAGIEYATPEQLQQGKDLTGEFWNIFKRNPQYLANKSEEAFLLQSSRGQALGYSYNRFSILTVESRKRLQLFIRQYEHNLINLESTLLFGYGGAAFSWETTYQRIGMNQPQTFAIISGPDGAINIQSNTEDDKQFPTDSLFVPEPLLQEYAALLLDREKKPYIVDVLVSNGLIVPAEISRIDLPDAYARSEDVAFVVRINYLNRRKLVEEFYFDAALRLIGRLEKRASHKKLWEKTSTEEVQKIFKENFEGVKDKTAKSVETIRQLETPIIEGSYGRISI